MKRAISIFCLTAVLLFASLPAQADVIANAAPSYSGTLMFIYHGNDNPKGLAAMLPMINDWFRTNKSYDGNYLDSLEIFGKFTSSPSEKSIVDLSFAGKKSGTWTSETPIEFYAVKGGNHVAMYWLEGGASSGFWSTEHIINDGGNQPNLSHLSVYNPLGHFSGSEDPVPTPEPASLLLVGGGLLGLAMLRRRIRR